MKRISLLATLGTVSLLVACSSSPKVDPYLGNNANYIYATAHTYLQKGAYDDAITAYQSLNSQYPFTHYAEMGDLDLIYAQYEEDNPALSLAAANRYIRLYPNSKHLDYAYYMRGVINFDNGRSFLERHTPYDMAKHNPIEYQNAYQDFTVVITQYPNSPYAQDARRRMVYLNNTMAQYQLNVATYYYQMKAYVAAVNRAQMVLIHYPQAPALQGALEIMVQSYQQLALPSLEKSAKLLLKANFPNDPLVKELPMPTLQVSAAAQQQLQSVAPAANESAPQKTVPVSVNITPSKHIAKPQNVTPPLPPPTGLQQEVRQPPLSTQS